MPLASAVAAGSNQIRSGVHAGQASRMRSHAGLVGEAGAGVEQHDLPAGHACRHQAPPHPSPQLLHTPCQLCLQPLKENCIITNNILYQKFWRNNILEENYLFSPKRLWQSLIPD